MARRDGCKGKVRHLDQQAAVVVLKRHNNAGLNVYRCQKCHGWHIGNSANKFQDRLDQLLAPKPPADTSGTLASIWPKR